MLKSSADPAGASVALISLWMLMCHQKPFQRQQIWRGGMRGKFEGMFMPHFTLRHTGLNAN
jgi:hypothetical protein